MTPSALAFEKNNYLVHRISFEKHRGPIPEGILVCHTCDNRACVNPQHLFLGTNSDNMADMVAKGRQNKLKGSAHGRAKLLESDVIAIRSSRGTSRRDLAERYGMSRGSIDDIMNRRSWAHLEDVSNG